MNSTARPRSRRPAPIAARNWRGFAGATALCLAAAAVAFLLASVVDDASLVLVFLLAVVLSAAMFGRAPALFAAGMSVLLFNLAFVPPRLSLSVADERFLFTFAVMLIVGLIVGQLTAGLKVQASAARQSEEQITSLYGISRDLGQALTVEQVAQIVDGFIRHHFDHGIVMWVRDRDAGLQIVLGVPDAALSLHASQVLDGVQDAQPSVERSVGGAGSARPVVVPLRGTMATRGALAIVDAEGAAMTPDNRQLLDTCSALVGSALERIHYIEVARDSAVQIEGERLRNSLLSAISHDLRTPLASLVGLSEALQLTRPLLTPQQGDIATAMAATGRRMSALVNNLLDMARLQSGVVHLDLQWQPVEEVVGAAIAAASSVLSQHRVEVDIPQDMSLVRFDAVLMERVLVNLLENAARYTPIGSRVCISTRVADDCFEMVVCDDGPGLPPGREADMFRKFERGHRESATPGVGLGLALCSAIVEAHGGRIAATAAPGGGARFSMRLPLGEPPVVLAAGELAKQSEP